MNQSTPRKPGRMAREADTTSPAATATPAVKPPYKLDQVEVLLMRPDGASIAEIMAATGWQQHSVRGAMAGTLKKRGLAITSDKVDGTRRYRAERPA